MFDFHGVRVVSVAASRHQGFGLLFILMHSAL